MCSAVEEDEFHRVGTNQDRNLVAVRRVIRRVSDEDLDPYAPILGRRHYGVQLYLCEVGGACGRPMTIYSTDGTSKAVARKKLDRAKKKLSAKGIVLDDEVSVFEPFDDEARLKEIGIAAPLGPARPRADVGPAEFLRAGSGEVLLVHRQRWCEELVVALEVIDTNWLTALLKHADGVDALNRNKLSEAATLLSDAVTLWPELLQARLDLALTRALGNDLDSAIEAVQGVEGPLRRVSKKTADACW